MKREDLRAIEGLTEEQINEIMRLHGVRMQPLIRPLYRVCRRS